jgi:predicted phosphodiesterase
MKLRITLISDTHTKHRQLEGFLPGGDLLIHAGDLMNSGYAPSEAIEFMNWFESQSQYDKKVFIAGNHDRLFEDEPSFIQQLLGERPTIDYLQDETLALYDMDEDRSVKIYGSPWQPEFYNWAFNLPKGGQALFNKWAAIPEYTDILITHGPPQDHLDVSGPPYNEPHLGCALLRLKVDKQPPKIHVFGHIHGGYGYKFHNGTHFFNASILTERYECRNRPVTFDWDRDTNEIEFIDEKV